MAKRYRARDRTVVRMERNGLTEVNLRSNEGRRISRKVSDEGVRLGKGNGADGVAANREVSTHRGQRILRSAPIGAEYESTGRITPHGMTEEEDTTASLGESADEDTAVLFGMTEGNRVYSHEMLSGVGSSSKSRSFTGETAERLRGESRRRKKSMRRRHRSGKVDFRQGADDIGVYAERFVGSRDTEDYDEQSQTDGISQDIYRSARDGLIYGARSTLDKYREKSTRLDRAESLAADREVTHAGSKGFFAGAQNDNGVKDSAAERGTAGKHRVDLNSGYAGKLRFDESEMKLESEYMAEAYRDKVKANHGRPVGYWGKRFREEFASEGAYDLYGVRKDALDDRVMPLTGEKILPSAQNDGGSSVDIRDVTRSGRKRFFAVAQDDVRGQTLNRRVRLGRREDSSHTFGMTGARINSSSRDGQGSGSRLKFRSSRLKLDRINGRSGKKNTQKAILKRRYQKELRKAYRGGITGGIGGGLFPNRIVEAAKKKIGMMASAFLELLKNKGAAVVGVLLLCCVLFISLIGFAGMIFEGTLTVMAATTYQSMDEDIHEVDAYYCGLEDALDSQINNMESTHSGYDEYRYKVDEISHNPFQLISYLTVKFGEFTLEDVRDELDRLFEEQYTLEVWDEVETKTRTVTDPDTGEESEEKYDWYVLNISLTNHGFDSVARNNLTEDQEKLYDVYNSTSGNRPELFDASQIPLEPGIGGGSDYEVPPEALSDEKFARMYDEACKYLGYPYVWGGSNPTTSFDCSGFVSWVINHSGNGWDVGRQTANGLRNLCTAISPDEAKPGDLIFFQGTYNTTGASHVGIYLGDGMMIHCGDPIQISSTNTQYWSVHYLGYGRLP